MPNRSPVDIQEYRLGIETALSGPHAHLARPLRERRPDRPVRRRPGGAAGAAATQFPRRKIFDVGVSVCTRELALAFLLRRLAARVPIKLAFANMHLLSVMQDRKVPAALLDDFLVLNDGIGLDIASFILHREGFPENLNGTDLVPALLKAVSPSTRVFLFGATPEVVGRAGEVLTKLCDITICGMSDGYGVMADRTFVAQRIREARADIVLVALGNPGQEAWIAEASPRLGAPLVIGVGALFDIITGDYPRAPALIRRLRLEWLHRLALEPSRLFRRYTGEAALFFFKVLRERLFGRSS